jgi:hypothetical protein
MNNKEDIYKLKQIVEKMDVIHHKKIFSILKKNNINISENRNGSFINITNLNTKIIQELNNYIYYINKQEKTLIDVENLKQELQKDFFDKDNKETITYTINNEYQ